MSWDKDKPIGSVAISQGDDAIRDNNAFLESALSQEHDFPGPSGGSDATEVLHTKVSLPDNAGDPTTLSSRLTLYGKDISTIIELFCKDSDGNVMQLTSGGLSALDALFRVASSSDAQRTMAAVLILANTIALQGAESGGTLRDLLKMTAGDVIQVGNTTTTTIELLVNALSGLTARHSGGTARILTADDAGPGNGLDADTVDGMEGADAFRRDAGFYVEKEIYSSLPSSAGKTSVAHGFNPSTPLFAQGKLICLVAEANYSVGDEVNLAYNQLGVVSLWCDNTNVNIIYNGGTWRLFNATTGAAATLTAANWKVVVRLLV